MATRNVAEGYFGSVGHGNPESSFCERTISTSFDFGLKAVPENVTIPVMEIPKGFCIDRISVVQTKVADQDISTLTFGMKSDDSVQIGGNFSVSDDATALARSSQPASTATVNCTVTGAEGATVTAPVPAAYFATAADTLCLIIPDGLTGDQIAKGAIDIAVHGFEVFAEAYDGNAQGREVYREKLQTANQEATNVSGGQFPLG